MKIDARNKACPQPVVLAINALKTCADGETAEVTVNEDVAVENLKRMANQKGYPVTVTSQNGEWTVTITKKGDAEAKAAEPASGNEETWNCAPAGKNEVIVIGTDQMGQGDPHLGYILMKSYLYALAQQDILPRTVIFFNSGAHLTCEGSESLEDIRSLQQRGVEIYTCGTCLEFYKIKDTVQVGEITNMYSIAEMMQQADKVVRI